MGEHTAKKAEDCTTSRYRGVTKHRRSGRWESHIWVAEKGKQVYLGGYELEEHAASAYDVAGLKVKGARARTNFSLDKYKELLSYLNQVSFDELVLAVRRQSQGFAKGSSAFKGVSKHVTGKWESRIIVNGSKHIYLGVFEDELMAARVHDKALVRLKGHAASSLINFPLRDYEEQLLENQQSEALQQYIPFPAPVAVAQVATGQSAGTSAPTLSSTLASMIQPGPNQVNNSAATEVASAAVQAAHQNHKIVQEKIAQQQQLLDLMQQQQNIDLNLKQQEKVPVSLEKEKTPIVADNSRDEKPDGVIVPDVLPAGEAPLVAVKKEEKEKEETKVADNTRDEKSNALPAPDVSPAGEASLVAVKKEEKEKTPIAADNTHDEKSNALPVPDVSPAGEAPPVNDNTHT